MSPYPESWYIAAETRELKSRPLSREVAETPLVLFRDHRGIAHALFDRCPHRNVQLSKGKVVKGRLQCPYHGWEFSGEGVCEHIPALPEDTHIPARACTRKIPVIEQQGYIWVWHGEREPESHEQPFYFPYYGAHGWRYDRLQATIHNSVSNIVENFIDNPHTGYIHGGLFRSPASHWVSNVLHTTEDGVRVEIDEETTTDSFLSRLLVKDKVIHQDRFIYPSIVEVSYTFGEQRRMIGYQVCTPVSALETRLYTHTTFHMGWLNPVVKGFAPWVGRIIMLQDVAILKNQGEMIARYGEDFTSVLPDTANLWIKAATKRLQRKEKLSPRQREIRFRL